ncbi:hypothetical protein [Actinacidiphila sp. bgisy167]|uniref:hypothetical protein n=1 Tax=Actinacidiphila sp. bgisy167 TaxID=3413797 RepID=UPI003D73399C
MESEPTRPHRRRSRSSWAVTAVAAAVLAAGGGGAYWASSAADGAVPRGSGGSGGASPRPLELDGAGRDAGVDLTVRGDLPDGPSSAAVRLPGDVSRAAVVRLARALDVPGTVTSDHGVWKAGGTPDGGGPVLRVGKEAPGAWSYAYYGGAPREGRAPVREDLAVPAAQALRVAAPVFAALGLQDARTDAREVSGVLRTVTADPRPAGLPTHGWRSAVLVASDGLLVAGHGMMAPLTRGDTYPVVSAKEALKLLERPGAGGDPGIGSCPTVVPKHPRGSGDGPRLPEVLPCLPTAHRQLEVRRAEFGLSAQQVAGRLALVPSWLFEVARKGETRTSVLAQPAVDPAHVRGGGASPAPTRPVAPVVSPVKVESYSAEGTELTLRFWGGVCSRYTASADESGAVVTVRVTGVQEDPGKACVMVAERFTRTVRLDAPLGGRKVVDLSDGSTVPGK